MGNNYSPCIEVVIIVRIVRAQTLVPLLGLIYKGPQMSLNETQQQVVDLINEGRSAKQIARKLKITERATKTYITKLTNNGYIGEQEVEPTPAITPATTPASSPAKRNANELVRLGATVQFIQMAGGYENAQKLIEQVISLR